MKPVDGYTVRRPERADIPRLKVLSRDLWPEADPEALARRWWWNDPVAPQCWIAAHDATGDIAAICGERRSVVMLAGQPVPASSVCDWDVSPHHKGKGLGRLLVDKSGETHPVMYTSSISESAAVGFARLGWKGDTLLPVLAASTHLATIAASLRPRRRYEARSFQVSAREHDGLSHVDTLWSSRPETLPVMVVRDRPFLQSHLALAPHRTYRLVVAFRGDEPRGYALFRVLPKGSFRRFGYSQIGLLSDYWVPSNDDDAFVCLVRAVSRDLVMRGVPILLALSTQRWARTTLARLGFLSEGTPVLGPKLRSFASRAMHLSAEPLPDFLGGWHVTFVDNDMDLAFGSNRE